MPEKGVSCSMKLCSDVRHTSSDSLSTALDHGAYTANSIASYISSSSDAAGQHAHGSTLNVIRDEARHCFDICN